MGELTRPFAARVHRSLALSSSTLRLAARRSTLSVALVVAAAASAFADTAMLSGRVIDKTGGALPGVTMTLANPATDAARVAVTGEGGRSTLPSLAPGRHRLDARLEGFRPVALAQLAVNVDAELTQDLQFEVGPCAEVVTVEGFTPAVDGSSPAVSTSIDREFVQNLPLDGRSYHDRTGRLAIPPSFDECPEPFAEGMPALMSRGQVGLRRHDRDDGRGSGPHESVDVHRRGGPGRDHGRQARLDPPQRQGQVDGGVAAQHPLPGHEGDRIHRDPTTYLASLDHPSRDAWQKPAEVVQALGLRRGDVVADIGAGSGYFALRFAPEVGPTGRVLAVDISAAMLEHLAKRAREAGVDNVATILAPADDPRLPAGGVNVVFVCNTWHHIDGRDTYLAKVKHALAPGGRLVIVDFHEDAPMGPPREMKLSRESVVNEAIRAGFVLSAEHTFLPHQYYLVFTAAPAAP